MSRPVQAGPRATSRLNGLDLARYLAFVGMVIVNFNVVMGTEGGTGGLAYLTQALQGRAAASFVVLAGIGLGLAAGSAESAESAGGRLGQTVTVTIKRAVFLLVLGLINMTIFDADILHYYAVYFLLGALLLPVSSRGLWGVILGLNLLFVAMVLVLDYETGWNWETYTYADVWTATGFVRNLMFNGWHPVIPWLSFLLLGIVLSRLSLGHRRTQIKLIGAGVAAILSAELLSAGLTALAAPDPELAELFTTAPVPPMPLYILAGSGAACLLVGLCLIGAQRAERSGLMNVIAPAGRQTLTLYIAHILIGMGTLEALGWLVGQGNDQTLARSVTAALVFCALATLYAWVSARWFKRGPIEALMRKLAG